MPPSRLCLLRSHRRCELPQWRDARADAHRGEEPSRPRPTTPADTWQTYRLPTPVDEARYEAVDFTTKKYRLALVFSSSFRGCRSTSVLWVVSYACAGQAQDRIKPHHWSCRMKMIRTLLLGLSLGLLTLLLAPLETGDEPALTPRRRRATSASTSVVLASPPVPKPVKKVTAFKPGDAQRGAGPLTASRLWSLPSSDGWSTISVAALAHTSSREICPSAIRARPQEQHYTGYQRVEMDTRYVVVPVG